MKQARAKVIAGIGLLLLFALMSVALRRSFTLETAGANDFYPRFRGAMLFWEEGIDPYSDQATAAIQQGMYGRPALPHEDQVLFVYPFHTVLLLLPVVLLPLDYSWIQAIWMATLLFALLGGVFIIRAVLGWRLSPLQFAALSLWTVLFYYSTRVVILGQLAGLVFLFLMATLLALQHERDALGGFLLVWTTVKPQMVIFIIPALLLWAIWQKRWRFVGSFFMGLGLVLAISFLLQPSWLSGFLEQLVTYPLYTTYAGSPLNWMVDLAPWLSLTGKRIVQLALLAWMVWEWRQLRSIKTVSADLFIVLGVTAITSALIFDQTATTNQITLYLPLLLGLCALEQSAPRHRYLVVVIFLGFILALWALFLLSIQGNQEHPVMYWPLPLLVSALLTVGRSFIRRNFSKASRYSGTQVWASQA